MLDFLLQDQYPLAVGFSHVTGKEGKGGKCKKQRCKKKTLQDYDICGNTVAAESYNTFYSPMLRLHFADVKWRILWAFIAAVILGQLYVFDF